MHNPLISIIIPTFNRELKVIEAIQSVLSQSYENFELIVIDDGSTDQTNQIVATVKDSRLIYRAIERSGVSRARNLGASIATGSFLAFLDSDDIWHKNKLKKQVAFHLENPQLLISQTQEIWIRNNKRVNPKHKHAKPTGYIFPESLHLCTITPSSVIMTKELFDSFEGFDEKMPACEDYDLWLRITAKHEVGLIDELLLTKYGGHEDQLSQTHAAMDRFRIYSLGKIILSGKLGESQIQQATQVFKNKAKILLNGVHKRKKRNSRLIEFLECLQEFDLNLTSFLQQSEEFLLAEINFA